jgi:lipopolysaccharide/colanic/teichoic acid biosynthesis glycosyltransferase
MTMIADPVNPPVTASPVYLVLKYMVDRLFALGLLVVAMPAILLAAAVVRATSPGPAFYSQVRLGQHGRPYRIYKIRTMHQNCEALTGPVWAQKNDPRVTALGRFLRQTHLDELPQLWNVLRGEMSLIGPRPERPEIVRDLERSLPGYRTRLLVKPGVTGLAQLLLPADSDLESVRRKLHLDVHYVGAAGPAMDIRIALATPLHLLAGMVQAMAGGLVRSCNPGQSAVQADAAADDAALKIIPPMRRRSAA